MQTYSTTLSGEPGRPTGIEVPPQVMAALGPKKKPAVQVTVNGYTYRSTVAVMGDRFMIPVSAAHRQAAGLAAGDAIVVGLALDTEPRVTELPADLSAALEAQTGARAAFDSLAPSRRKEMIRQLEDAKTEDTRTRRREKLLADLAAR